MDVVDKILGISYDEIRIVQNADSIAQEKYPSIDKQFQRIYGFASKNAQDYGWEGIAKQHPDLFKQALNIAKKIKR